jgi:hypothetical protein
MMAACEERLRQRNPDELATLLTRVESRLGKPAERPEDLECARAMAHRLASVLTGQRLRAALDGLREGSRGGENFSHEKTTRILPGRSENH